MESDESKFPLRSFSTHLNAQDIEALDFVEMLTCNADIVQMDTLADILARNSETEYLRGHSITDPQTFKRVAPLITYEDIAPLVARIAQGDKAPILTAEPISLFFSSSGTSSGQPKLIPTHTVYNEVGNMFNALMKKSAGELGLVEDGADKWLYFFFVKPEFYTPGGLPVRTAVTSLCKNAEFHSFAKVCLTSPAEVVLCEDVAQSMYCHLLCGLIRRLEVACIGFVFASSMVRVMHCLQERWAELVEDIRTGTLSAAVVLDPVVRGVVEALIAVSGGPNPTLAEQVEAECMQQPMWQGIIRRLWPRAKYVSTVTTGSMEQYVSMLEFYTGGLPLVSPFYGASEGSFGVNMAPFCHPFDVSYTLIPNMAYFEFLPVSADHTYNAEAGCGASPSSLVDLVDVKLGADYEVVITTYAGLYRYRMGDMLRVTGFHNKAPQFHFVGRRNVVLSIDVDKTDEETLGRAVKVAMSAHMEEAGWHLVEYTSYADLSTVPGHYVLFWELRRHDGGMATRENTELLRGGVLEACCLATEESLDSIYRRGRVWDKSIGPLEIRVVTLDSFNEVMDLCLKEGSSFSQYKPPRCVSKSNHKHAPILDLLNSRVCLSSFSPQCPSWVPPVGLLSISKGGTSIS